MVSTVSSDLEAKAGQLRRLVLMSTSAAGAGHPTSCLSAVELMTVLMFGGHFQADYRDPSKPTNDRLLFSKGHAAPLLYALYVLLGVIKEKELLSLRQVNSRLEGHPSMEFPYTEAATGSLGQGLSIAAGIALAAKQNKLDYRTYVLLGDGEMMEGSNWEAMALAQHYKLGNLTALVDVNRLEQVGPTMFEWDMEQLAQKWRAFGWLPVVVENGNNLAEVEHAFNYCREIDDQTPKVILAKTVKGAGIKAVENELKWHGKPIPESDWGQSVEVKKEVAKETEPASRQLAGILSKLDQLTND